MYIALVTNKARPELRTQVKLASSCIKGAKVEATAQFGCYPDDSILHVCSERAGKLLSLTAKRVDSSRWVDSSAAR